MGVCQSSEDMDIKGYAYPCVTKMPQKGKDCLMFPEQWGHHVLGGT